MRKFIGTVLTVMIAFLVAGCSSTTKSVDSGDSLKINTMKGKYNFETSLVSKNESVKLNNLFGTELDLYEIVLNVENKGTDELDFSLITFTLVDENDNKVGSTISNGMLGLEDDVISSKDSKNVKLYFAYIDSNYDTSAVETSKVSKLKIGVPVSASKSDATYSVERDSYYINLK